MSMTPELADQSKEANCVFSAFKETSHLLPHSTVSLRSDSRSENISTCFYISDALSQPGYRVVSSAYMAILGKTMSGRSLMNKRKRVGPRIEPCGIPALIANSEDNFPSETVVNLRPLRK